MSAADQPWPRNSLLQWKNWTNTEFSFPMYYIQEYDPATPLETLLGANIAFRGLRKMRTAEQCWPRNSLLSWKKWANIIIPNTHVVYSTVRSRNSPRDTFGSNYCFPGVAGNKYSWPALASKFFVIMEKLSKYWILFIYVIYLRIRSRNPPGDTFGGTHCFPRVTGN